MKNSDHNYIGYRGVRTKNRDVFFLTLPKYVKAHDQLHDGLSALAQGLVGRYDVAGKTIVSRIPFIALMQRQVVSAFDCLASFQAYQAWVMIRPAVEIPLIIGKFHDDKTAYDVWIKRETNPKPYSKLFSGTNLRSKSLPRADDIQNVLKSLNDQFLHPNPFYYHRHLWLAERPDKKITVAIDYFDEQSQIEPHILAFVHLVAIIHDSMKQMLEDRVGAIKEAPPLTRVIEKRFRIRAKKILTSNDEQAKRILSELGCWPQK